MKELLNGWMDGWMDRCMESRVVHLSRLVRL